MSRIFHLVAGPVALLAHQGGWDEILLVAGPIVVIIAVLAVAKRRVDAFEREPPEPLGTDAVLDERSPAHRAPADPSGSEPGGDDR